MADEVKRRPGKIGENGQSRHAFRQIGHLAQESAPPTQHGPTQQHRKCLARDGHWQERHVPTELRAGRRHQAKRDHPSSVRGEIPSYGYSVNQYICGNLCHHSP